MAHEREGGRVIGITPDIRQTAQLCQEAGFDAKDCVSMDQFLLNFNSVIKSKFTRSLRIGHEEVPQDGSSVLLVNQAHRMSQQQERKLFDAAERLQLKIIYIGDPDAVSSRERGGMFRHYHRIANGQDLSSKFNARANWLGRAVKYVRNFKLRDALHLILEADKRKRNDPSKNKYWMRGVRELKDVTAAEKALVATWQKDTNSQPLRTLKTLRAERAKRPYTGRAQRSYSPF